VSSRECGKNHRALNDALKTLDGRYDPLGQAWIGAVPSVEVVQSALAIAEAAEVSVANTIDCIKAGGALLAFFPSANSWSQEVRDDLVKQYAQTFEGALNTTVAAIIDRKSCPFKGAFPPSVPELAEVIEAENCKVHAVKYRAKKIEEAREEEDRRNAETLTRTPEEVERRKAFAAKVLRRVPTNRKDA